MIIDKLILIQGKQTDQQFADKLGIHRVSWQRIKKRRVPLSDKFLIRIQRAFPELKTAINIFLATGATKETDTATFPTTPYQTAQNRFLLAFKTWWGCVVLRTKKLWHNSREL